MRYPPDSTRLCTELSKSRTEPFEPKYQVKQSTSRHHHIPAPDYNRSTLSPQGEATLGIRELSYLSSTDIFQSKLKVMGAAAARLPRPRRTPPRGWYIASVICMVGRAIAHGR